jgi:hypothetical protein
MMARACGPSEAKSSGYDVAALRWIIRMRRWDKDERDARQAIVDEHMAALVDYGTTPPGLQPCARQRSVGAAGLSLSATAIAKGLGIGRASVCRVLGAVERSAA